jgi:hypothetical protein
MALGDEAVGLLQATALVQVWEGLTIEGGYQYGDIDGETGGSLPSRLVVHGALLGLRWQQPLLPWLDLYGRADALLHVGSLEVQASGLTVEDSALAPGFAVAAGLEIHIPTTELFGDDPTSGARHFTLGVTIDGGYTWGADLAFESAGVSGGLDGAGGGSPLAIVDMGGLNLSSGLFRLGSIVRF